MLYPKQKEKINKKSASKISKASKSQAISYILTEYDQEREHVLQEKRIEDPNNLNSWRLHNLRKSEDYYDISAEEEQLFCTIQENYEKAISRTSDYKADLYQHIANWYGVIYQPDKTDTSVLVGYTFRDIFLVSHFAPSSLRKGLDLIKHAASDSMPIVIAVPEFLSNQLEHDFIILDRFHNSLHERSL